MKTKWVRVDVMHSSGTRREWLRLPTWLAEWPRRTAKDRAVFDDEAQPWIVRELSIYETSEHYRGIEWTVARPPAEFVRREVAHSRAALIAARGIIARSGRTSPPSTEPGMASDPTPSALLASLLAMAEEHDATVARYTPGSPTYVEHAGAMPGARERICAEMRERAATLRAAATRLAAVSRVADWCDDEARRLQSSATAYTSPYGDDMAEAKGEGIAEAGKRIREALEGEGDE
jgi:hypothetical protein